MIYRVSLLLASSALSLGLGTAALAQKEARVPGAAAEAPDENQIIVTARRVEERLQDVPISITVFNQVQLDNRNVVNASDLAKFTPSLAANNRFGNSNSSFAIRGFIQEGPTSPSVGVYFADVIALRANGGTTAGNGAGPGSFFDLQNVQVLKGPQGTLFGRNTTGGAVLLVPQKPTSRTEGYIEGSFGNYNMHRVEAVLNLPIRDDFRVRLGIDHQDRDGYLHNLANGQPGVPVIGPKDFNDVNYTAVRLGVVADLTPNLENYTLATWSRSNTNGTLPRMYTDAFAPSSNPANYRAAFYDAQIAAMGNGYYNVSNGMPNPFEIIEQWRVINTTTWHASDTITLKNIASYGEFREQLASMIYGDNGATLGVGGAPIHYNYAVGVQPAKGGYNVAQSTATEEIQLQGRTPNDRLTYQIGAYGEWADPLNGFQATRTGNFADCVDIETLQCVDTRGRATVIAPGVTAEGRVASIAQSYSKYWFRNYGVYGQGTYKLTDKLSFTAGIRYTSDTSRGQGQSVKVLFPAANTPNFTCSNPVPLVAGGTSAQIQADASRCRIYRRVHSAKPTWLLDLDYKPTDDILIYGKYSRGYRQGSINVSSYGLETWGPEKVDTYELGAKTSWRGPVHGNFNISGFYNDFRNQQLQLGANACTAAQLVTLPTQCPFIAAPAAGIANVGKSRIYGVEVEASVSPFAGFNIDGSYAYLNSKILEATLPAAPPLGFASFNPVAVGGAIPLTPRNKFSVTGAYRLPLDPSIGKVVLAATYSYQSNSDGSTSSVRSGLYRLPKQHLLNLNVNWNNVAGKPVDLALFVTNATKEKFYLFTPGASFGFDSLFLNEPRMYGMRLKYRFGR